jgi:hypothetical protein
VDGAAMRIRHWIWAIKTVSLAWAISGLILWAIGGDKIRWLLPWMPLFFVLWATQCVLEAFEQPNNRWVWAGVALWLFMAGIIWWVK